MRVLSAETMAKDGDCADGITGPGEDVLTDNSMDCWKYTQNGASWVNGNTDHRPTRRTARSAPTATALAVRPTTIPSSACRAKNAPSCDTHAPLV